MNEKIPELSIEPMTDESGALIILEQDSGGNLDRVAIHPLHLRHMAERFGLIASGDLEAQRAIASLTRRLHVLHERISHLADWLAIHSNHEHASLSYEQTYARATADIADEFCADFGNDPIELNTQENGAIELPQKLRPLKKGEVTSPLPTVEFGSTRSPKKEVRKAPQLDLAGIEER